MSARRILSWITLIGLVVVVVLLYSLAARADGCVGGTISWVDGSPALARSGESDEVNIDLVGTFLHVQPESGKDTDGSWDYPENVVSYQLAGTETAVSVCADLIPVFTFASSDPGGVATQVSSTTIVVDATVEEWNAWTITFTRGRLTAI